MKFRIVFELDCLPETSLGDIRSLVPIAATAFEKACAPLGECRLQKTESRAVPGSAPSLDQAVARALTQPEPPEPIETPLPPTRGVG